MIRGSPGRPVTAAGTGGRPGQRPRQPGRVPQCHRTVDSESAGGPGTGVTR